MKCHGCGVDKDMCAPEVYPYPEDSIIDDEPIAPLIPLQVSGKPWRLAIVCHECYHKLGADMWIDQACWEAIKPNVPFAELPKSFRRH